MGILNESESLENLELGDAAAGSSSVSLLTKAIRGLLATAVLGSVAAYGAINVKPELVEYLSFIPGMESVETQCSAGPCGAGPCGAGPCGAGPCGAGSCGASSCGTDSGACSLDASPSCDLMDQPLVEQSGETPTEVGTPEQ